MDVIFWNTSPTWQTGRNFFTRYIGPYKIAHWIRKKNHTAQIIDFITLVDEEFLFNVTKKFITTETKILAISTTFLCNRYYTWADGSRQRVPEHVINVLRLIKKLYPTINIVIGGYMSDRLLFDNLADATIMSYTTASEDIFLEYLEHLKLNTPLPLGKLTYSYMGIPHSKHCRIVYDTARNPTYNIETDDFRFIHQDIILWGEALPMDMSRGCIFACRFCQYPHLGKGKLDYTRSMEMIRDEMIYNYENFGTTFYMALDDTFNDTEIKMRNFNNMVATLPFKINYSAYLRADLIDRFPDTAYMLKESGLWGAYHGIESLHPYASNLLGKAWSGKKAKEFIPKLFHDIWKHEVPLFLNFIIGLPKETEADVLNTIDWFKQNKLHGIDFGYLGLYGPSNNLSPWVILSEFDRNAEKYGFTFDKSIPAGESSVGWRNETWTTETAMKFTNQIIKPQVRDITHIGSWNMGPLLFLGYDKETLMNTKVKNFDWSKTDMLNQSKFDEYFVKLLAL